MDLNKSLKRRITRIQQKTADYDDTIPDTFVALYSLGYTTSGILKKLNINYATFKKWCKEHPEMIKAVDLGYEILEEQYLELGRKYLITKRGAPKLDTKLYKLLGDRLFNWDKETPKNIPDKITIELIDSMLT